MDAANKLRMVARRLRNHLASHGLSPLARSVLDEGLTYLSPAKLRRMEDALQSLAGVEGGIILIDDYHDYGGCRTAVEDSWRVIPRMSLRTGPTRSCASDRAEVDSM